MSGVSAPRRRGGKVSAFQGEMQERLCLSCNTPFESQGAHNRMCDPCRSKTSLDTQFGFHGPQRAGKMTHA